MLVSIEVVGDRELIERFSQLSPSAMAALQKKVRILALQLQAWVQTRKLNGQVLNRVSGALSRSIFQKVEVVGQAVYGYVYSAGDVKYAGIHEYGGRIPAHVIEPKKASVLAFSIGGKQVFASKVNHPGSTMPERSYLRSSLRDMSTTISMGMKEAVINDIKNKVRGH